MGTVDRIRPIPERMRRARQLAGMSQIELARYLRMTDRQVSRWEQGYSSPTVKSLRLFSNLTGASIPWLCGYTDKRTGDWE